MVVNNAANIPSVSNTAVVGTGTAFNTLAYSTTPTASNLAERDSNANLSSNSMIVGYTTTATAAGTTTLTVSSTQHQYFTGSTTQTVVLPVTSTLVLGQSFTIVNNSTGVVTVQSSGGNTIQMMSANTTLTVVCILTSGTTAASWSSNPYGVIGTTVSSYIAPGSAVAISAGVPANVTSINLTPGTWVLSCMGCTGATGGVVNNSYTSISTTSATLGTNFGLDFVGLSTIAIGGGFVSVDSGTIPSLVVTITTNTTYYLVVQANTATGTPKGFGNISAIRIA